MGAPESLLLAFTDKMEMGEGAGAPKLPAWLLAPTEPQSIIPSLVGYQNQTPWANQNFKGCRYPV